jgi:hypothetical protein
VTVCTTQFLRLATVERKALGAPDLPIAIAQHPLGGLGPDAVKSRAEAIFGDVVKGLTGAA